MFYLKQTNKQHILLTHHYFAFNSLKKHFLLLIPIYKKIKGVGMEIFLGETLHLILLYSPGVFLTHTVLLMLFLRYLTACNAGDVGLIPRSGRLPGVGNDNSLLKSCLESPMARGAWWRWGGGRQPTCVTPRLF